MHNYRMRRIWPSMCHKLLGNGTWYVLLATVWLHLWAAATGSMRLRVSRTLLLGSTIPSACRYALIIWMELIIQHKIKYILYLKIDKNYRGICSMLTSEPSDLGNWLWSLLTCSSRLASLMRVNLFLAEIWKDLIFLCRYGGGTAQHPRHGSDCEALSEKQLKLPSCNVKHRSPSSP